MDKEGQVKLKKTCVVHFVKIQIFQKMRNPNAPVQQDMLELSSQLVLDWPLN